MCEEILIENNTDQTPADSPIVKIIGSKSLLSYNPRTILNTFVITFVR